MQISVFMFAANDKYEIEYSISKLLLHKKYVKEIIVCGVIDNLTQKYLRKRFVCDDVGVIFLQEEADNVFSIDRYLLLAKYEWMVFFHSGDAWNNRIFANIDYKVDQCDCIVYKYSVWRHAYQMPYNLKKICDDRIHDKEHCDDIIRSSFVIFKKGVLEYVYQTKDIVINIKSMLDLIQIIVSNSKVWGISELSGEVWDKYESSKPLYDNQEYHKYIELIVNKLEDRDLLYDFIVYFWDSIGIKRIVNDLVNKCNSMNLGELQIAIEKCITDNMNSYCDEFNMLRSKYNVTHNHYIAMRSWLANELDSNYIEDKLIAMDLKKVAIYGGGRHGKMLAKALKRANVNIDYWIDKNLAGQSIDGVGIILPSDDLPNVDGIIVSLYNEFDKIKRDLSGKTSARIISLLELINMEAYNV